MNLLRIIEKHLPIGSEDWEDVVLEHGLHFPGRGRTALMRKCSTLCQKQIPTGNPDCLEDVKLAKRIKCVVDNKAAVGNAEEEPNLKDVEFGESDADPTPSDGTSPSSTRPKVAATESATSAATL